METGLAISVQDVRKTFKVHYDKGRSLKEKLLFRERNRYEAREVLKGVTFSVKKGEAVGLVGQNGCGKSTLLKLLTKIMYPSSGTVETTGRVSALIELGAGFHPDMTGRENIYTNAAIFGLSRSEIDQRLEDIIEFSELGEYVDNPVRTYSSGMYMRLAFSVAINVEADILLVDEILAVGDAAFQAKCFNRLREIKAKGTTIVIVSHSLGQIEQICDRSIWICDGVIREIGKPRDVHPAYLEYMGKRFDKAIALPVEELPEEETATEEERAELNDEAAPKNRWGNGQAKITKVELLNQNEIQQNRFRTGEPFEIRISYKVTSKLEHPACGIGIFRNDGLQCYGTNTCIDGVNNVKLGSKGCVTFRASELLLLPGEYTVDVAIHTEDGFAYDYYRYATSFNIYSDIQDVGIARMRHTWEISPQ